MLAGQPPARARQIRGSSVVGCGERAFKLRPPGRKSLVLSKVPSRSQAVVLCSGGVMDVVLYFPFGMLSRVRPTPKLFSCTSHCAALRSADGDFP